MAFRRRENRNSLKHIAEDEGPDVIVKAAEAILQSKTPNAIDRIHNEEALEKLIDETSALAENLEGETRMRCLMAQRCLLDTQDEFERTED